MSCRLVLLGGILGLVLGPIAGSRIEGILAGNPLSRPYQGETGLAGFMYGLLLGPFVGMVVLPFLISLAQRLLRRG